MSLKPTSAPSAVSARPGEERLRQTEAVKRLLVVSAPSGAGKTTLCRRTLQDFPRFTLSISCTTRGPRGTEKDGQDYHFLTETEFEDGIRAGRFAEWAKVHGKYYGTLKKTIEKAIATGRHVLLDIDVQGAESLRRAFPSETWSVFVSPPSLTVLEQRLRARGTDREEVIQERMKNARHEMEEAPRFHRVLVNDDLDRAYTELKGWVSEIFPA